MSHPTSALPAPRADPGHAAPPEPVSSTAPAAATPAAGPALPDIIVRTEPLLGHLSTESDPTAGGRLTVCVTAIDSDTGRPLSGQVLCGEELLGALGEQLTHPHDGPNGPEHTADTPSTLRLRTEDGRTASITLRPQALPHNVESIEPYRNVLDLPWPFKLNAAATSPAIWVEQHEAASTQPSFRLIETFQRYCRISLGIRAAIVIGAVGATIGAALLHAHLHGVAAWAYVMAGIYLLMVVVLYIQVRTSVHTRIEILLVRLTQSLERHPGPMWRRVRMIRRTNRRIRLLAQLVERIPWELRTRHPDVIRSAARKAAAVRDLHTTVTEPPGGCTECVRIHLCRLFAHNLSLVLQERWYDMEEAEPSARAVRWGERVMWAVAGILLAGAGALLLTSRATKDAPLGQLGAYTAFGAAILALSRGGVVPGTYQQALELAKSLRST